MTNQSATSSANCRSNHRASRPAPGQTTDERTRTGAGSGTLTSWRITRIENECGKSDAAHRCEKLLVHNVSLISPLNHAIR